MERVEQTSEVDTSFTAIIKDVRQKIIDLMTNKTQNSDNTQFGQAKLFPR